MSDNKQSSLDRGGVLQLETKCLLRTFNDTTQDATHVIDGESSVIVGFQLA